MKTLSRIAVLNDAINYYWGKPERRCANNFGTCQYKPSDTSEGCAIGRLIPLKLAESLPQGDGVNRDVVFNKLPKRIQKLGVNFLSALQSLHDGSNFENMNETTVIHRMKDYVNVNKIVFPE